MPLIHERAFRVRHYECDAFGHLNQTNYLRYMQEAALDASAAAGYDIARYQAMQRQWLIRETDMTFIRPLQYGDTAVVKTWVQDFRRVRSRRAYELRQAETGELVAHAHTEWVFLDSQSLHPVTVPEEMILAFVPEGVPSQSQRREPFPEFSHPTEELFTMRRRVEWRDIDAAGHVNNAMYLAYIGECTVQMAAAQGWPMARLLTDGMAFVTRHGRIEYKQPALPGDECEIAMFVADLKQDTAVQHVTMTRTSDNALLARACIEFAWVKQVTGQILPFPPTA